MVDEIVDWWVSHRGPHWTPPVYAVRSVRYPTATTAWSVAMVGLALAVTNAAALWWPASGYGDEPDLGGLRWTVLGAAVCGVTAGGRWTARACRILLRAPLPRSAPPATRRANVGLPLILVAATGMWTATLQWLGIAFVPLTLAVIAVGFAVAVAGAPLVFAVRRFEQRTGQAVVSRNPLGRGLGLEARTEGG